MSEDEIKLVQPVIDMIRDMLSDQTCDDFTLSNTPTSLALWRKIKAWSDPNDEDEWTLLDTSAKTLTFHETTIFDYLVHCATVANGNESPKTAITWDGTMPF